MRFFMIAITVHNIWNDICWWFTASWKPVFIWKIVFVILAFVGKKWQIFQVLTGRISLHISSVPEMMVFYSRGKWICWFYDMTPSWNHLPPWIASKHQWFPIRMAPVALYTPYLVVSFSKNSNNTIKLDSTALHLPTHAWHPQMLPQHDSQPLQLPNSINP